MPRKRPAASETVRELLNAFDAPDPRHREVLRQTLDRLHATLLASRDRLERYLRLFPESLLQEARNQSQLVFPAFQAGERPEEYHVVRPVTVDEVFEFVRQELEKQFFRPDALISPEHTKRYLVAQLAREEREVFVALFLDNRNRPLAFENLFYGTIDGCQVHIREVVKRTLHHNAAALIFAHNHPSGEPEPSQADESLTHRLKDALALIDVRVLDHIIVGGAKTVSFAECGLI